MGESYSRQSVRVLCSESKIVRDNARNYKDYGVYAEIMSIKYTIDNIEGIISDATIFGTTNPELTIEEFRDLDKDMHDKLSAIRETLNTMKPLVDQLGMLHDEMCDLRDIATGGSSRRYSESDD